MNGLLANLVLLWATFGSLVFFTVVIVLGFVLPTKFTGTNDLALAVRRIVGAMALIAVVMSVMMILSQWLLSQYFVDALSVGEMMQDAFVPGLVIYLMLGLPFVLIRTLQLYLKSQKGIEAA